MKYLSYIIFLSLIISNSAAFSKDSVSKKKEKLYHNFLENERRWNWEVPIWIPGFRGEFAYGDVSLEGEDGTTPIPEHPIEPPHPWDTFKRLFKSDFFLNFVFMSRVSYTSNKFYAQIDGFSGSVGRSTTFRTNNAELVKAKFSTNLYRIYGGYEILEKWSKSEKVRYQLYTYVGVRFHDINVVTDVFDIEDYASLNPFWTEPLIGVKNDLSLRRWRFVLNGDVGFYGPNQQLSYMLNFNSEFRISNLVSVRAGWTQWYAKLDKNYKGEPLKLKMNLSGPATSVSFHF